MILPTKTAQDLEALACKECHVPSPGSRDILGVLVNVCPKCGEPCIGPPWECKACGWTASTEPQLCPCQAIAEVLVDSKDPTKAEYPVDAAEVSTAKAKAPASRTEKEVLLASVTAESDPKPIAEIGIK